MRLVALLVLVLGVALAGGAIFFASEHYRKLEASLANRTGDMEIVKVLAAMTPLHYGDKIDRESSEQAIQWVDWPSHALPEGVFTDVQELLGEDYAQIRIVTRAIEPGELILKTKVTGFGDESRVSMRVAKGKRAFSIKIDAVSGVAGLVGPGDRVDIILTRTIEDQLFSSVVLQDVLVIAMDQTASTERSIAKVARTATVEVDPNEAQKLALAQQVGKLSMSLRGVGEATTSELEPVSIHDLPDQPETQEYVDTSKSVRVRKGVDVQDVQVE